MSDRDSLVDRANDEQADEQNTEATDETSGSNRQQLTQRMPDELHDAVEQFSEDMGMSKNAAINLLVRENLQNRNYL